MWIKLVLLAIAFLVVVGLLWRELRLDRIAREEQELWLDMTRPIDEQGKRWPERRYL